MAPALHFREYHLSIVLFFTHSRHRQQQTAAQNTTQQQRSIFRLQPVESTDGSEPDVPDDDGVSLANELRDASGKRSALINITEIDIQVAQFYHGNVVNGVKPSIYCRQLWWL